MHPVASSVPGPSQVLTILATYRMRWLVPTVALGLLAGLYALVRPNTWEASQALILRNEAANRQETSGTFAQTGEMKTVQETILELIKSRGVLTAALTTVGPPDRERGSVAAWPRPKDVDNLCDALKVSAPKGAEFGKTEVFYLKVRDHSPSRATALVAAVADQLEASFQNLRDAKAQSTVQELVKAVKVARDDLVHSTARLAGIEKKVGSDLAELRMLQESSSGESALRRTVTEIRNELRQVRSSEKAHEGLLALLHEAQNEPSRLVALPNPLLESQPALRRLKEGLIDAELRTADLKGRRSDQHPLVLAAQEAEREIAEHLHAELANAIRALEVDRRLTQGRIALLEEQLASANDRLNQLAGLRADYCNLVSETRSCATLLERAEQKLAEARISQATAGVSLIGKIDTPDAGSAPLGPGRYAIALAGLAGGLLAGLGIVFLTVPMPQPPTAESSRRNGSANGKPYGDRLSLHQALAKIHWRQGLNF
jgi:uncharacterized protein involved in exopolysaccharide biosynthesis